MTMRKSEKKKLIPLWERALLTLDEASAYTGIGIHNLKKLAREEEGLIIWVGNKRLFKRKRLEEILENIQSI